uniref:Uncharacterized protein n=1 Tax=Candidatus Methanogaster sp. ANME-2c ERB4 TaxID=2759911 RepID=A0A7G9YN93_9EURY|nr:hypothetical protein OCBBGKCP_00034 [Methanosarcinales archaeon ANME-2c ERB4]
MIELETLIASVVAVAAIVGLILQWRKLRQYGLRWVILEPKSMMEIAEEIASDLTIHYKGRTIADMTKYEFILHNTGLVPIEKSDIVVPLKWVGPGIVLGARVVVTDPPVDLSLSIQGHEVEFAWPIFNQRCKSLVEILCEGGGRNERGELTGQIRNISNIDKKRISILDEEEIIERMRLRSQMRTPRFLQPLNRVFLNRWFIHSSQWIAAIYLIAIALTLYEEEPLLGIAAGIVFVIFASVWFVFFRSPYSSLVKKGREQAKKASTAT